ncbi:bifunctional oligoribonuclease/PAP phosphatase NrnA [Patescibacteria group bacterium]
MALSHLQQVANTLKKDEHKRVLLVAPENPDGDSLGSLIGLGIFLQKIGKDVYMAAGGETLSAYDFLPQRDKIKTKLSLAPHLMISLNTRKANVGELTYEKEGRLLNIRVMSKDGKFDAKDVQISSEVEQSFDAIVVINSPDLEQLGDSFRDNSELFYESTIINIDHHASNEGFGQINYIDMRASSTAELVYNIVSEMDDEKIDIEIATSLLTGIIDSTESFQSARTAPEAFNIAAQLVDKGAKQQMIIKHLYKTKSMSALKLWGHLLTKLKYEQDLHLVWVAVPNSTLERHDSSHRDLGGIVDELLRSAPQAELVLILHEDIEKQFIRGQIHAPSNRNAREIAELFHEAKGNENSANFRLDQQDLEEAHTYVISQIKNFYVINI